MNETNHPTLPASSACPRRTLLLRWLAAVALIVIAATLAWYWAWPRPIASRGGLYFPWRMELPGPTCAQGDARWENEMLGATTDTLHAAGCAVSSAAMVLACYGVDVDPGRLNQFLQKHDGYTPEGWLYWEKAAEFVPGVAEKAYEDEPSHARIDWNLLHGNPVIVRIQLPANKHFVVIAGKSGWDYLIRDPGAGASRGLYPLREIASRIEALRYLRKLK